MARPDHQDAALVMRLAEWQTACGLPTALNWLWSERFVTNYAQFVERYPLGSEGDRSAALICTYFETIGALYKHGFINEDLLFDWIAVGSIWDRLKQYVLGRRTEAPTTTLWTNFEALATAYKRITREYST